MGKFRSLIYFSGRTGNIVGRKGRDGSYISSVYQPSVFNPNTPEQQQIRRKFTLLSQFSSRLGGAIKHGFYNQDVKGLTVQNAFMRQNFEHGITGIWPNLDVNFEKIILSNGNVTPPYDPAGNFDPNNFIMEASWIDNSGIGNAKPDDTVVSVIYARNRQQTLYSTNTGQRIDQRAQIEVPLSWVGDTVDFWIYMLRHDASDSSQSIHLCSVAI